METFLWSNLSIAPDGQAVASKISVNSHGDPHQPAAGDFVADAVYINTEQGRRRIWARTSSVSIGEAGPVTAAAHELDVNNDQGALPDDPGGPRSLYGTWISGTASNGGTHVGSAALVISSAWGQWRHGVFIDRADVGLTMGGTMSNRVGIDFAQTRLRLAPLSWPPASPPNGQVELYVQYAATGKLQLIARFANSWIILATEV